MRNVKAERFGGSAIDDCIFGSVNATRRHYEMVAEALAQAEKCHSRAERSVHGRDGA
jgi:hypothetical protein